MPEDYSPSMQDYLKVIFSLTEDNERAATHSIAERVGVTAASATGMIQRMAAANPPLVEYQKHHGVRLTPDGRKSALEIIRHHRLLELFLNRMLGYSWDEVHTEADRLEHVISEELEERISQVLGEPVRDPHGEPIPTRDFQLPPQSQLPLSSLQPGQQAVVEWVQSAGSDFLRYLAEIGLVPGAQLLVLKRSDFDSNLRLRVTGQPLEIVLGPQVTENIFVEVL